MHGNLGELYVRRNESPELHAIQCCNRSPTRSVVDTWMSLVAALAPNPLLILYSAILQGQLHVARRNVCKNQVISVLLGADQEIKKNSK